MSYAATVQFLYGLQQHGIKLGLDRVRALLHRMGDPQRRYVSVHIGGTNGKGSTAALTASVLQAAGRRVGLYTSPHLIDFRERIRVDGVMIPEGRVIALVEALRAAAAPDLAPTFFEFTTALALLHFAESGVETAVVEVGLGGRFDATNVLEPAATAITTIAMDHEAYLGSTVEAIAFEKAGIIKPGVPLVVGRIDGPAWSVIDARAEAQAAPVFRLGREFRVDGWSPDDCRYLGRTAHYDRLSCPLSGRMQLDNLACALALVEQLSAQGPAISEEAVRAGVRQVSWEGRLEVVGHAPTVLVDGAHNPAAAAQLAVYLAEWRRAHPGSLVHGIMGMMQDKRPREFVTPLLPQFDRLWFTQAALPRAATGATLLDVLQDLAPSARVAATPADALAAATAEAAPTDLICITGSLMVVGEIKALLRGRSLSPVRG